MPRDLMPSLFLDSLDKISIMRPQNNPGDGVSLYKGYLPLLLVAAIWSTFLSMIKVEMTDLVPVALMAGRTFIVALLSSVTFMAHGIRRGAPRVL
jgi:hypothetical protein